ncbi:hypothetical protein [Spirosoma litoris]
MSKEFYLEKAWDWTNRLYDPTLTDIRKAIEEIQKVDTDYGFLYVLINNDSEHILEVHHNLRVSIVLFGDRGDELIKYAEDWATVDRLYQYLLAGKLDILKDYFTEGLLPAS